MRHNPAAGAVVIMLRALKMHGMAQAVGELTEGGDRRPGGEVDGLSAQGGSLFRRSLLINANSAMALTHAGWIETMCGAAEAGRAMVE